MKKIPIKQKATDSLESLTMSLGARQKAMYYTSSTQITENQYEVNALWLTSWLAWKMISRRAKDMTKKWRDIKSSNLNTAQKDQFEQLEKKLKVKKTIKEAQQWALLTGTAGLIIITKTDVSIPLDEKDQIVKLIPVDRWSFHHSGKLQSNIMKDSFGQPEYYTLNDGHQKIHHTKLILFKGGERLPSDTEKFHGISLTERIYPVIKRYEALGLNIGDLVTEAKQDILKMTGYNDKLADGQEDLIRKTITNTQQIKSTTNLLLIDADNDYQQKELSFAGLKELLVEFKSDVAGAGDMPITLVFGQSAAGFASGEEDTRNYHESIASDQEDMSRPAIDHIDTLLGNMLWGGLPEDWWYEFNPLGEMTEETKANVLATKTTAYSDLHDRAILTKAQIRKELKNTGLIQSITDEDTNP